LKFFSAELAPRCIAAWPLFGTIGKTGEASGEEFLSSFGANGKRERGGIERKAINFLNTTN
jgi:hypothetical protein